MPLVMSTLEVGIPFASTYFTCTGRQRQLQLQELMARYSDIESLGVWKFHQTISALFDMTPVSNRSRLSSRVFSTVAMVGI